MSRRYRVQCIVRSDRLNHHQRLLSIGGTNPDGSRWQISEQQAIAAIEARKWSFYIASAGQETEIIIALSKYGTKYLKTALDRVQPDGLLALPECH